MSPSIAAGSAVPSLVNWIHADEFGLTYGPNDADIGAVTTWLRSNGLQVYQVAKGRTVHELWIL